MYSFYIYVLDVPGSSQDTNSLAVLPWICSETGSKGRTIQAIISRESTLSFDFAHSVTFLAFLKSTLASVLILCTGQQ